MYLAYNAPHTPLQATDKYLNRFDTIKDNRRRTYAAMVSAMDDGIGRVLNTLDELHLSDNTIVVFLSDNGGPEPHNASNNGLLRGTKGDLFEGGIRVPFAMKWTGTIPEGVVYNKPIISLDIFATIVNQTQKPIATKNPIDGVNLLPYVLGENKNAPHDYLFWRKFDAQTYATRNAQGDKLLLMPEQSMLFNLCEDISEETNLIETSTSISDSLQKTFNNWNANNKAPIFMGLFQNKDYDKMNPDRFTNYKIKK